MQIRHFIYIYLWARLEVGTGVLQSGNAVVSLYWQRWQLIQVSVDGVSVSRYRYS